jgi:hypothetical protein
LFRARGRGASYSLRWYCPTLAPVERGDVFRASTNLFWRGVNKYQNKGRETTSDRSLERGMAFGGASYRVAFAGIPTGGLHAGSTIRRTAIGGERMNIVMLTNTFTPHVGRLAPCFSTKT